MNLQAFRNECKDKFEAGEKPQGILEVYRTNRNNEEFRAGRIIEELMEYILFLEKNNG